MAKHNEQAKVVDMPTPTPVIATISKEIASTEIVLPHKAFVVDGVIQPADKAELIAHIVSEAVVRQFKNNEDARYKAHLKKVEEGKETAADNPCTVEKLLERFATYWPEVGEGGLTTTERMRQDACLKAIRKAIAEHNAHVIAHHTGLEIGGRKTFGDASNVKVPTGDDRAAWINTLLGTTNAGWVERIQVELEALQAEKASEKPAKGEASVVKVEALAL